MAVDRDGLEILSRAECLRLLAGHPVGRVAISHNALPAILPVIFGVLGDDVVFAPSTGSGLLSAVENNVVAFETDDSDPASPFRWSVLVVGVAHRVDEGDPDWSAALDLDLRTWDGHRPEHLIRLPTERFLGRQTTWDRGTTVEASVARQDETVAARR